MRHTVCKMKALGGGKYFAIIMCYYMHAQFKRRVLRACFINRGMGCTLNEDMNNVVILHINGKGYVDSVVFIMLHWFKLLDATTIFGATTL